MKHINITLSGEVQGVFFRDYAKEKADETSVKGFVRNEPDGSLYIEAEGDEKELDIFLKEIKKGPELAKINNIKVEDGGHKKFQGFEIE